MKKFIGILAILILFSIFAVFILIRIAVKKLSSPDYLTAKIEQKLNCRAEIAETNTNIFSLPASVEIKGLALGARDSFVENKTPQSKREKMSNPLIQCENFVLHVGLMDLLKRKLDISKMLAEGMNVNMRVKKGGDNDIGKLFRKRESAIASTSTEPSPNAAKTKQMPLDALHALRLASFILRESAIKVFAPKKTSYEFSNISVEMKDFALDRKLLKNSNSGNLHLDGEMRVLDNTKADGQMQIAFVPFDLNAKVKPFDEAEILNPELRGTLRVSKTAEFAQIPALAEINQRLAKLKTLAALDVPELNISKLREDVVFPFVYKKGMMKLEENTNVDSGDLLLVLAKDSWFNALDRQHFFKAQVSLSEEISEEIISKSREELKKRINELDDDTVLDELFAAITDENGKILQINFTSSGYINQPKIEQDSSRELLASASKLLVKTQKKRLLDKAVNELNSKGLDKNLRKLEEKLDIKITDKDKLKEGLKKLLDKF